MPFYIIPYFYRPTQTILRNKKIRRKLRYRQSVIITFYQKIINQHKNLPICFAFCKKRVKCIKVICMNPKSTPILRGVPLSALICLFRRLRPAAAKQKKRAQYCKKQPSHFQFPICYKIIKELPASRNYSNFSHINLLRPNYTICFFKNQLLYYLLLKPNQVYFFLCLCI